MVLVCKFPDDIEASKIAQEKIAKMRWGDTCEYVYYPTCIYLFDGWLPLIVTYKHWQKNTKLGKFLITCEMASSVAESRPLSLM